MQLQSVRLQTSFLLLLLLTVLVHTVICDDETYEEISIDEHKRSESSVAVAPSVPRDGNDEPEPRYDLVLALIEKYLKEKSPRKVEKEKNENLGTESIRVGCNRETELDETTEEGSVNYPSTGTYLNNENCMWKIRVPADKVIQLTIRRLSIEATEECRWDKLEIFDGSSSDDNGHRLASLCGFILPTNIYVTSGNEAVLKFSSDDSIGYGGFQIDYRPLTSTTTTASVGGVIGTKQDRISQAVTSSVDSSSNVVKCLGIKDLKQTSGVIKFPMDGNYADNLFCRWRILAPAGKVIQLRVTSIDIEEPEECHSCCWYDWLSLYDSRTENISSLMVKLCGTAAPSTPFTTSSNVALIVFRSNAANGDEGFQIGYQFLQKEKAKSSLGPCDGKVAEIRTAKGVIESPGFKEGKFPENVLCRWRIIAPTGQVIRMNFDNLNIENDVTCAFDSVSIYDGFNRTAPVIGRFCGNKIPPEVTSSGSTLLVKFESDSSESDGGFSLNWNFMEKGVLHRNGTPGCEGETAVLDQSEGVFTSPNYGEGSEYPNNAKCSWRITVESSLRVLLRFEKFSLETPLIGTECYDVVSVYDGASESAPLLGSYCGEDTPSDLMASANQLYISFTSDESIKAPGFFARYAVKNTSANAYGADCGVSDVMPKVYSRIVGGVEATPHSWPWQISMKYRGHGWKHWCGGSILYPRWIVTAAHCVEKTDSASDFKVVLGEHNRLLNEGTEKELNVEEIILHEKYEKATHDNDIALFRLPEDIQYNRNMKPICLPKEDVQSNVLCITTGWGNTQSTGNESLLNQVYIPVISRIECNQPNWYGGKVTDNMICAGYPEGRKDSCQGDSGGPMVCLSEGRWKLYGVTSWGKGCAVAQHPGLYTRVTRYLEWIESKTKIN